MYVCIRIYKLVYEQIIHAKMNVYKRSILYFNDQWTESSQQLSITKKHKPFFTTQSA